MGDRNPHVKHGPVLFDSSAIFRESDADRLGRWRSTFDRLRVALAELPANDDLDHMMLLLDRASARRAGQRDFQC